ncbi:ImmA/IrrE family metallo-endopeptidase [Alicyclobacillus fodiniaquatilis]|uniref:ImmA/IrrE family metallo-endopeptidase n=1 Tax=Alicyclobacillus fodiniaquatilis TaxID=1661150 RepID=A0ABW4JGY4_9BACL
MNIEKLLTNLYRTNNIRYPHEIQLDLIADNFHLTVLRLPIDAVAGSKLIIIDSRKPLQVQREQLAHEIGHRVLHNGSQTEMHPLFRKLQENQTQIFAMLALAPTYMLLNFLPESPQYLEHQTAWLAEIFRVTYEFMERRLQLFERSRIS